MVFDKIAIINQVKNESYPSNWRVYRGRGSYGCAITWLIGAVCLIGLFISAWYGMKELLFFILGIPCLVCIIGTYVCIRNTKNDKLSILVFLPEAVVQCYAGDLNKTTCLYFPNISEINLAKQTEVSGEEGSISTTVHYWLDVYTNDGRYVKWWTSDCFGDRRSILKNVIAAHNYYLYQHEL